MDYLKEIQKLPLEIQDILWSSFGAQINRELAKKYNLDKVQSNLMIDLTNDIYLGFLNINNLKDKIINLLKLVPNKAQLLSLDLAGLKLLIADDYFKGAIKKFILANQGDLNIYQSTVDKEKEAIKKEGEIFKKENEDKGAGLKFINLDDDIEEAVSPAQEKAEAISLFKEDILNILLFKEGQEIFSIYNEALVQLLRTDRDFKRNLEAALFVNQERLTSDHLLLEERDVPPTIANWLKDFIKTNGSEMFDDLVLAQYLSTSPNAKKLKPVEKELLRKLLKLYRNLSFFPESMNNMALSDWQIIPVEQVEQTTVKPVESKQVDELESSLSQYAPGSFEYKALAQEIVRLKKKNTKK